MECSFLNDEDFDSFIRERNTMHIIWSDLELMVLNNKECTFIFTHFSLKYSKEDIVGFFKTRNIINVIPWI